MQIKKYKLFVVEDDPDDLYLLQCMLKKSFIDTEITVARDGLEASQILDQLAASDPSEHPDLILLDLNLPGIGGVNLLEKISKSDSLRKIRVAILSSSVRKSDITACQALGARGYFEKPLDRGHLENLRKILSPDADASP